jgi:hypothetical protein
MIRCYAHTDTQSFTLSSHSFTRAANCLESLISQVVKRVVTIPASTVPAKPFHTMDASAPPSDNAYDAVVIGTGLPNAILAAALARVGRRVLHIDR